MNRDVLLDALDRLVPDCGAEPTDWPDVLRRGRVARRRLVLTPRRRALLVAVALVVAAVALLVTPAFGVRRLLFGRGKAPPDNDYAPGKFVRGARKQPPEVLLRRVLAGLGSGSAIESARLGPAPAHTHAHPKDGLWLYITAPDAESPLHGPVTRDEVRRYNLAHWEAQLVAGAFWDELYLHATRPLAGCSILGPRSGGSCLSSIKPHGQRFTNPPADAYLDFLRRVGEHDDFSVVSIRYLDPLQRAPIIVLRAKKRDDFTLLWNEPGKVDAMGFGASRSVPFEGWFLEVRDSHGPFLIASANFRAEDASSYWNSADVMHRH